MTQTQFTFLDLSGYSFTGKSAYNNLIAEFDGFHAHAFDFEFDLVRTKNGIADLYTALVSEWSPVRSCETLRGFKKVIQSYGGNKKVIDRLLTTGRHYDAAFPGFSRLSHEYVDDLIDASWRGQWPYAFEQSPIIQTVAYKILYNLGFKNIFESTVYLASPSKEFFLERTRRYLSDVLTANVSPESNVIVMNNVCEPFNPIRSLRFFDNAKSIIIDRDPRDIYLAAWNYTNKDGSKGWKATLGKDVEDFVQRFKLYRKNVDTTPYPNLLRVTFEELVLDYETTLMRLYDFLEIEPSVHSRKKQFFDPAVSATGIGMWKHGSRRSDIDYISAHLGEYCKNY